MRQGLIGTTAHKTTKPPHCDYAMVDCPINKFPEVN